MTVYTAQLVAPSVSDFSSAQDVQFAASVPMRDRPFLEVTVSRTNDPALVKLLETAARSGKETCIILNGVRQPLIGVVTAIDYTAHTARITTAPGKWEVVRLSTVLKARTANPRYRGNKDAAKPASTRTAPPPLA